MTAEELVRLAARLGVILEAKGGRLLATGFQNTLEHHELRAAIKAKKAEVLAYLEKTPPAEPQPVGDHWRTRLRSVAWILGWSPMNLMAWEEHLEKHPEQREEIISSAESRAAMVDPEARARRLREEWTRRLVQVSRAHGFSEERLRRAEEWAATAPTEEIARVCMRLEGESSLANSA
jgi:hypothetical protein